MLALIHQRDHPLTTHAGCNHRSGCIRLPDIGGHLFLATIYLGRLEPKLKAFLKSIQNSLFENLAIKTQATIMSPVSFFDLSD
jgi:hypothetical protein